MSKKRVHGIIHSASVAAGSVGAGLAQIPGSDQPVLISIQMTMIGELARQHNVSISEATAANLLLTFAAAKGGRGLSQWLIGWIPGWGNAINATTAASITEAIGWSAVAFFEMQTISETIDKTD